MTQIERYTHKGYTIIIDQDEDPTSPREWDNLGTMIAWHRDYDLGDKSEIKDALDHAHGRDRIVPRAIVERYLRIFHGATVVLPLYLLDHSGLSMSAGSASPFDPGGWDTSMVGWIFDTPAGREMCGTELEHVEEALRDEVATYSQYLEGDIEGFTVLDNDNNVVESVWGFYGTDECKREAEGIVDGLPPNVPFIRPKITVERVTLGMTQEHSEDGNPVYVVVLTADEVAHLDLDPTLRNVL